MNEHFDIVMIGHICRDVITEGERHRSVPGGAVFYSSIAAARSGASIFVYSKGDASAMELYRPMTEAGVSFTNAASKESTSMECIYFGENKERRRVVHLSSAPEYSSQDLSTLPEGKIYHVAGLVAGEFREELLPELAEKNRPIAMDVQTMLRHSINAELKYKDWPNKRKYLPMIDYLKTDAAEALILTGEVDREKAALILNEWGCREVMLTHNSEVLICTEGRFYRAPYTARNLSGRSGRGDTTIAAYLAERTAGKDPEAAVKYAAALCSIKMENEGPFTGDRSDVKRRMTQEIVG